MSEKEHYITINGIPFTEKELAEYCEECLLTSGKDWKKKLGEFFLDWLSPDKHIHVKTSGSTGPPKTISLEKEKMIVSARKTIQYFKLRKNDLALLCLPIEYIAGKMMVVRAIAGKLNLLITEPGATPLENFLPDSCINFIPMVPLQVQKTLEANSGTTTLNCVKNILIGGAPIHHQLEKELQKINASAFHSYGMTETMSHVAIRRINGENPEKEYRALPGISFSIDAEGCLIIHAPFLTREPIITRDVVELKTETSFVWIGRADDVINSGGIKIHPSVVEEKISFLFSTRFFITSGADTELGQKVILVLEDQPWDEERMEELEQRLKELLSKFERPREIIFEKPFAETPTGKIIRRQTE